VLACRAYGAKDALDLHVVGQVRPGDVAAGGEHLPTVQVVLARPAHLTELVGALGAAAGLPRRLHGGQEEGNENADNRDDYQQLDEGKPSVS
jgi:hypothetical protein